MASPGIPKSSQFIPFSTAYNGSQLCQSSHRIIPHVQYIQLIPWLWHTHWLTSIPRILKSSQFSNITSLYHFCDLQWTTTIRTIPENHSKCPIYPVDTMVVAHTHWLTSIPRILKSSQFSNITSFYHFCDLQWTTTIRTIPKSFQMSNITRLYHVCGLHWTTTIPIIPIDTVHHYFDPTGPIGFVFTGPPGGVGAIVRRTQGRSRNWVVGTGIYTSQRGYAANNW